MTKEAGKERFEDHLKLVEETVKGLESGRLDLDESLQKFEAGIKALRKCYEILEAAEKRIQILIKEKDGTLTAEEYTPERAGAEKSSAPSAGRKKKSDLDASEKLF